MCVRCQESDGKVHDAYTKTKLARANLFADENAIEVTYLTFASKRPDSHYLYFIIP